MANWAKSAGRAGSVRAGERVCSDESNHASWRGYRSIVVFLVQIMSVLVVVEIFWATSRWPGVDIDNHTPAVLACSQSSGHRFQKGYIHLRPWGIWYTCQFPPMNIDGSVCASCAGGMVNAIRARNIASSPLSAPYC